MGEDNIKLPPGFRFYPSDEELVLHFLYRKALRLPSHPDLIPDLHINLFDPWDLPGKALESENQWYFFSKQSNDNTDHNSPNGYWNPLGVEEPITRGSNQVGIKKYLVFYIGEPSMATKTDWIMHQYHLLDCATTTRSSKNKRGSRKMVSSDQWVLCRVYDQNSGGQGSFSDDGPELSGMDEVFLSLDDLDDISFPN